MALSLIKIAKSAFGKLECICAGGSRFREIYICLADFAAMGTCLKIYCFNNRRSACKRGIIADTRRKDMGINAIDGIGEIDIRAYFVLIYRES